MAESTRLYDVIIIGGGPGGMTAGLYTARGMASTLLINRGALGGMVLLTTRYENFPGYPGGVESFELAQRFEQHMLEFGVEVEMDTIEELRHLGDGPLFELVGGDTTYRAAAVIVATGSTPRLLDAPGTRKLFGRGVSICAVCDGAFYRGKNVAVVGGGDSAVEEGVYLTKFADSVTIIHRRDQLRASPASAEEAFKNPKIHFMWDSVVDEILGTEKVLGAKVRNVKTGAVTDIDVSGVFVYIGATGNSEFIKLGVEKTDDGYLKTGRLGETNIPGLFGVGDIRDEPFKQAIIASGHGAATALLVEKYLRTIPKKILDEYAPV
jgi:thioredoxin reductase (NADPH)